MLSALLNLGLWLLGRLGAWLAGYGLIIALVALHRLHKVTQGRKRLRPVSSRDAILVTGATSGIGLAVSEHLYRLGYSLVAAYFDQNEPGYAQLKKLEQELRNKRQQQPQRMLFVKLDIQNEKEIDAAHEKCAAFLRDHKLQLWGLINNAGVGSLQPFAWFQRRFVRRMVETNLLGSMLVAQKFLPLLIKSHGRLINVSSGLAMVPGPFYTSYGITKAGLVYFTRCLNQELGEFGGVRAVCVLPHNHIKSTNMCATNVAQVVGALDEMDKEQRELFRPQWEQHCKRARELEEATRLHAKQVSSLASTTTRQTPAASGGGVAGAIMGTLTRLTGRSATLTLADSGLLEGFEDALRLEEPPELHFAGDNIFNYVVGPILLSLPPAALKLLSAAISDNLYK